MIPVSLSMSTVDWYFSFENIKGFFLQDEDGTPDGPDFDYSTTNLGLINRKYQTDAEFDPTGIKTQWERFEFYIHHLNKHSEPGVSYKLLYLGRHGEGWHNVEEAVVGTHMWDCYWSRLDGDGKIIWADAELTQVGINQALKANEFWKESLVSAKIPAPESYYASPLERCLSTANYTFSGLSLPSSKPFKLVIKELLREDLGVHTCDRRSTRSHIAKKWPEFTIEDGFAEKDELWDPDYRESESAHVYRLKLFFDDIFQNDPATFISCTSHSGTITSILKGVGHRKFSLQTGGLIPVFLRIQKHSGPRPSEKLDSPTKPPVCHPSSKV